jgi:hypothetical protein
MPPIRAERLPELFNWFEVALWPALGLVLALRSRLWPDPSRRRRARVAAWTLLAFGLSDWAEARTGNRWWHPWWLLAWKGICLTVLSLLALEAWLRRDRRRVGRPLGRQRSPRQNDGGRPFGRPP